MLTPVCCCVSFLSSRLQEVNSMINKRLKDVLFTDQWSEVCMERLSPFGYVLVSNDFYYQHICTVWLLKRSDEPLRSMLYAIADEISAFCCCFRLILFPKQRTEWWFYNMRVMSAYLHSSTVCKAHDAKSGSHCLLVGFILFTISLFSISLLYFALLLCIGLPSSNNLWGVGEAHWGT